ncbi:hypothetical protein E3Q23_01720 [Wallemia mellicola]|uniref:RING-type domain-containing protein n=1 Tax=Wallemia mellicola TaxID=1708541 RepID=A0A4T0MNR1_9BASI|nr:hypothetical protein E3Q23_01720 [Wallemia mellicola]TIB85230.1 hypothetical protein E3Q21_02041 [Wallemia mellicola]TIB88462.1 hypothetical protein E3Q20_02034 [Wallemia mellicola]TIC10709.1 hypothetical protein E3Q15_02947 [Wallemia mellicola]TIC40482.1 hypothetical protein E3Q07_02109 [Wallemia mellicola]
MNVSTQQPTRSDAFILKPSTNSDFQWNDILQVIVPTISPLESFNLHSEPATCPICLDRHTAPRMLLCGHIFCLHCLLQHLSNSENQKFTKCAVCGDVFYLKNVKPVHFYNIYPSTSIVDLTLLRKPPSSQLALPLGHFYPSSLIPPQEIPPSFIPIVFTFAKYMLATSSSLNSLYVNDIHKLQSEREKNQGDHFTQMFIDQATEKVIDATHTINETIDTPILHQIEERQQDICNQLSKRSEYVPPEHTRDYFFYQSSQGLPIYLHTLDTRILLHQFKSYSLFPPKLSLPIEHIQEATMDENLRKRCKYLSHVPLGSDIIFVETSLKDIVDEETLLFFKEPLEQRKTRRNAKHRREERESAKAAKRAMILENERIAQQAEALSTKSFPQMVSTPRPIEEEDEETQLNHALALSAAATRSQNGGGGPWGTSFATALSSQDAINNQSKHDMETFDAQWNAAIEQQGTTQENENNGKKKKKKKTLVLGAIGSRRA